MHFLGFYTVSSENSNVRWLLTSKVRVATSVNYTFMIYMQT